MPIPTATFRAGFRESLPITLGYFPIGISFGIAAARAGLSPLEAVFVSAVIYAGAAQFLALALLTGGAPVIVSALSVLAMNLRHVLYGPAILEAAKDRAATRFSWLWGGWLSDGAFGAAIVGVSRSKENFSERWMLGLGIGPYFSWALGTGTGAVFGGGAVEDFPAVDAALGFLLPALFLAMLLAVLSRKQLAVIVASIVVTVPASLMFSTTVGIVTGMIAGSLVGLIRIRGLER
ncbi:AzlC family ABC transporter permease [Pelagibacterium halotolerans]|uniref:AzlC family ABC transporter permease n=1 Tax=Pelagibacterium halotolerans TaxID=531813 RepID=UPI00384EC09C